MKLSDVIDNVIDRARQGAHCERPDRQLRRSVLAFRVAERVHSLPAEEARVLVLELLDAALVERVRERGLEFDADGRLR